MRDYYKFWGIDRSVFSCLDIESDYFVPEGFDSTLKRLMFFCQQGSPLLLLTSKPGHGKTVLSRYIYDQIPTETHEVLIASLLTDLPECGWLQQKFLKFFGFSGEDNLADTLAALDDLNEEDRKLLIIIDNAHKMTDACYSEIASFLRLQSISHNCISILLIGNEPARARLEKSTVANQLSFNASLPPLSLDECKEFMRFQLANRKLPAETFADDAIYIVHELTGGTFQQIATVAENCLMEAFIQEEKIVRPACAIKAASYVIRKSERHLREKYIPKPVAVRQRQANPSSSQKLAKKVTNIKLSELLFDEDAS